MSLSSTLNNSLPCSSALQCCINQPPPPCSARGCRCGCVSPAAPCRHRALSSSSSRLCVPCRFPNLSTAMPSAFSLAGSPGQHTAWGCWRWGKRLFTLQNVRKAFADSQRDISTKPPGTASDWCCVSFLNPAWPHTPGSQLPGKGSTAPACSGPFSPSRCCRCRSLGAY